MQVALIDMSVRLAYRPPPMDNQQRWEETMRLFARLSLGLLGLGLASVASAHSLILDSGYIGRGHVRFSVEEGVLKDGATVTVNHDRNRCAISKFGSPTICTKALFFPWTGTLKLDGKDRRGLAHYQVLNADGSQSDLSLVEVSRRNDVYKVVVWAKNTRGRKIPTETAFLNVSFGS